MNKLEIESEIDKLYSDEDKFNKRLEHPITGDLSRNIIAKLIEEKQELKDRVKITQFIMFFNIACFCFIIYLNK